MAFILFDEKISFHNSLFKKHVKQQTFSSFATHFIEDFGILSIQIRDVLRCNNTVHDGQIGLTYNTRINIIVSGNWIHYWIIQHENEQLQLLPVLLTVQYQYYQ